jgi:hypothetical protein
MVNSVDEYVTEETNENQSANTDWFSATKHLKDNLAK